MSMLDDLAREILAVSTTDAPWLDALGLAFKLGIDVTPSEVLGVEVIGNAIAYDQSAGDHMRQLLVASGLAIWAMREWDLADADDAAVRYVAERIVCLPQREASAPELLLRRLAPA